MKYLMDTFSWFFNPIVTEKDDFSEFFTNAKSREKAKLIRRVLKEANAEQRELVNKYRETTKAT